MADDLNIPANMDEYIKGKKNKKYGVDAWPQWKG